MIVNQKSELLKYQKDIDVTAEDLNGDDEELKAMNIIDIDTISDEIFNSSVDEQIKTLNMNSYAPDDLTEIFENRWNFFNVLYKEDSEMLNQSKEVKNSFYKTLMDKISDRYGINYQCGDIILNRISRSMYNVFILGYKQTVVDIIISYILTNKNRLSKSYNDNGRILSFSKKFQKRGDAVIIANLLSVIREIIEDEELSFSEILELLSKNDMNDEAIYTLNHYGGNDSAAELIIDDNDNSFRNVIFDILKNNSEGYTEIITLIQTRLYNIFPMKDKDSK